MAQAGTHGLLVVLQGIDTAGKDATIKGVFAQVDHQLVSVKHFRAPSEDEARHDFLWRAHKAAPARGMVALWHRSHYEDLIVPVAAGAWTPRIGSEYTRRAAAIHDFEHLLETHAGTLIARFWLDISREEQLRRLALRRHHKRWKLTPADLASYEQYDALHGAYEALAQAMPDLCRVSADDRLVRNLTIARRVVSLLEEYAAGWRQESRVISG